MNEEKKEQTSEMIEIAGSDCMAYGHRVWTRLALCGPGHIPGG